MGSMLHKFRLLRKSKSYHRSKPDAPPFPFLSLPAEIRDLIYRWVFGPQAIHLASDRGRVISFRCSQTDPSPTSDCCTRPFAYSHLAAETRGERAQSPINTALFYVCRQVYHEASAVLFESVAFQTNSMVTWVLFAGSVPPHHLARVRKLRACWIALPCLTMAPVPPDDPRYAEYEHYTVFMDGHFQEFWDIVGSQMTGLRDLGFVMDYLGQYLSRATTAEWHRQLIKVTGLQNFNLGVWDTFGGAPGLAGKNEAKAKREMEILLQYLSKQMCSQREM
ncbi:predicted protein [Uncinocarpus reesii 1704]|uniref:DUF7730 domain-containing protein n=1 Tax=Uncinocarpus reesii (strain UAMH 1704) TaxID=336963 RepID=C4JXX8_UNCRE|nr:uncharacterized protein UREG_07029 [Uncinocarpus reesii 1704]EEP82164.1 predicted protein [Uncinocarpus reesii 1704]